MTSLTGVYPSKSSWYLLLVVTESNLLPAANTSDVTESLYMVRGNSDTPYNNSTSGFSVGGPAGGSGAFGAYRFGSTGSGTNYSGTPVGGTVLIYSSSATVAHDADGSKTITVSASHAAAATLGTASIGSTNITLTTLVQAPGAPTAVTATRVSDTSTTVAWTNNDPSNGARTQNQVQQSVNGGSYTTAATISPASSVAVTTAANRKTTYKVNASNGSGTSAWSTASAALYTTPAAPTGVAAAKDGSGNIIISWTDNVAFIEHQHVIEHSTDGGSTWSSLTTVAYGSTSYTHTSPSTSVTHTYRVSAQNTDTGALTSAAVTSNTVTLLSAPNAPTLPAFNPYQDKAANFVMTWVHNPTDTTAQTAYEVNYSTNGGTTWTSSSKTTSTTSAYTFAGGTYAANAALTVRVRTWGQATTGGSDGTGASPWSSQATVTFKTKPVASIITPADSSTATSSDLVVVLGFSQAESATFVSATVGLYDSSDVLLEQKPSTVLTSTTFATALADSTTYKVKATVTDSNGLTSSQVTSTFSVSYSPPVTAGISLSFLPQSGSVQVDLTFPTPGAGEVDAATVTIVRTFNGSDEAVQTKYTVSGSSMSFVDPTAGLNGTNLYTVTTYSADNASVSATASIDVPQGEFAYMNAGTGYASVIRFYLQPGLSSKPSRNSLLVRTANRAQPVALYGVNTTLEVSGVGQLLDGTDSTVEDVEAFLQTAGRGCYRDGTGRRLFGLLAGSIGNRTPWMADFNFTCTEAS